MYLCNYVWTRFSSHFVWYCTHADDVLSPKETHYRRSLFWLRFFRWTIFISKSYFLQKPNVFGNTENENISLLTLSGMKKKTVYPSRRVKSFFYLVSSFSLSFIFPSYALHFYVIACYQLWIMISIEIWSK